MRAQRTVVAMPPTAEAPSAAALDLARSWSDRLASYRLVLLVTGAGVSVSAGLPTFRGPGGLYEPGERSPRPGPDDHDAADEADDDDDDDDDHPAPRGARWLNPSPDELADPATRQASLRTWARLRTTIAAAAPTLAHHTIAAASHRPGVALVTTNVDDLHERAGTDHTLHLHGQLMRDRCQTGLACWGGPHRRPDSPPAAGAQALGVEQACPRCGGPTRPDIVLFGEQVPSYVTEEAHRLAWHCDALVTIGTTLQTSTSDALRLIARSTGATHLHVDPQALPDTPARGRATPPVHLPGSADALVPVLLQHLTP